MSKPFRRNLANSRLTEFESLPQRVETFPNAVSGKVVRIVRLFTVALVVLALLLLQILPALAANGCPSPGPEFGEHIAGMAPEHPLLDSRHFGG